LICDQGSFRCNKGIIGIYVWGNQAAQPHGVMRGTITAIQTAFAGTDSLGSILVEGQEANNPADKASVTLTKQTELFRRDGTELRYEDLKTGSQVEVLFTGPVLESYPVQFTATKVIVQEVR
jgi:hypothetical protein